MSTEPQGVPKSIWAIGDLELDPVPVRLTSHRSVRASHHRVYARVPPAAAAPIETGHHRPRRADLTLVCVLLLVLAVGLFAAAYLLGYAAGLSEGKSLRGATTSLSPSPHADVPVSGAPQ